MTEIVFRGELGNQDAKAIQMLMNHVMTQIGLELKDAGEAQSIRPGEYYPLRARDPLAPPGRVRALLRDREEVRRLYAGLHGQVIRVGNEQVLIEVQNDVHDAVGGPGNGPGARA